MTDFTHGVDLIALDGLTGRAVTAILNGALQVGMMWC